MKDEESEENPERNRGKERREERGRGQPTKEEVREGEGFGMARNEEGLERGRKY